MLTIRKRIEKKRKQKQKNPNIKIPAVNKLQNVFRNELARKAMIKQTR